MVLRARPTTKPRRWRTPLSLLLAGAMVALMVPVAANHVQNVPGSGGAHYTIEFDHAGDNEWWVEVEARATNGDSIFIMFATVEGTSSGHYMKFAANTYERQQAGWSKFAPDRAFYVPPGKRVMFEAHMTDGTTGETGIVRSCWFTHPAGIEQCASSSTSTTTSSGDFNAPFTGVRGNAYWVQANVGTNGPAIAKVEVREHLNGVWSAFQPMQKKDWSPTAWAASYHIPQGTIVQLRATATNGQTDLSSCRQWVPPSGQDAAIVPCPGSSTTTTTAPTAFDATFSGAKGNDYWAEVVVGANKAVDIVYLRIDCGTELHNGLHPMQYRADWGKWIIGKGIPSGTHVSFVAQHNTAGGATEYDYSGGYVWPAATPTTGC